MNKNINFKVAHIGMPKTATSYLQESIFPKLVNNYYNHYWCYNNLYPQITTKKIKLLNGLYSWEGFAGEYFNGNNRINIAYNLKDSGITKIIIGVRDRDSLVDRMYRQYVKAGGTMSPKKFIHSDKFTLHYVDQDFLVFLYEDLFGKDNVLVIDQKNINQNTFDQIANFLGVDRYQFKNNKKNNVSISAYYYFILRYLNYFVPSYNNKSIFRKKFPHILKFHGLFRRIDKILKLKDFNLTKKYYS
jgi:hypothetical protein